MDFFQSQSYNKMSNKKRLREDQVRILERSFTSNKKLEPERKLQLADELGIPPRQVAIWYQNKRARWRTQSLELDCGAMQLRLDAALAEKRQLEREVDRLRRELGKANEMLFALDHKKSTVICSVSSWDQEEEARSSSLCDVNNNSNNIDIKVQGNNGNNNVIVDDQVLQFDPELLACFVDGSDY